MGELAFCVLKSTKIKRFKASLYLKRVFLHLRLSNRCDFGVTAFVVHLVCARFCCAEAIDYDTHHSGT